MAQKDDEARLATHRERAAKVEARIAHREKMKGDTLYKKLSRALTSMTAAYDATGEDVQDDDAFQDAMDMLERKMSALRAPTNGGS